MLTIKEEEIKDTFPWGESYNDFYEVVYHDNNEIARYSQEYNWINKLIIKAYELGKQDSQMKA